MGKDGIGWGAMVAMSSLIMARKGFTGVEPLFSECPEDAWIDGLGSRFEILNLYFKPYAACRWAQPAVKGVLGIVREHGLRLDDLERIVVRTFRAATELSRLHPRNTEEAQYNLAYPVAAALMDGEVGPRQVLPPRIHDASLLKLADRVEVEVDEEIEKAFPAKAFAEVVVWTKAGAPISSGTVEASWEPPGALPSDSELEQKFFRLVEPVLDASRTEGIVSMIRRLDEVDDMGRLIGACLSPGTV
jgi:2-methylcitrate dehydratase PrpD